ncbi:MAG: hypothetical protein WBI20_01380 [Burkholderiaceae bacterium]
MKSFLLLCGRTCALMVVLLCAVSALAHESITTEARKNYLSRLQEAQKIQAGNNSVSTRAQALYQIGVILDEIRELFNQDIISHGAVKGLESSLLLSELGRAGFQQVLSSKIGLYLADLHFYREAIRLDSKAAFADHARYQLLKSHFYDSFTNDPLEPLSQAREELLELLNIGEGLLKVRGANINAEEVKFILAIHYLQAINQKLIGKEEGQKKFKKLLDELRKDFPQSLKPLTLEALNQ